MSLWFDLFVYRADAVFSIAYGVIAGIFSYIILNGIPLALRKASGGRIVPGNYEFAEPWVIPPGSIIPYWMRVLLFRSQWDT